LNYTNPERYAGEVSIYFGKPFSVSPFWEMENRTKAIQEIKKVASKKLKVLTTHIDDLDNYETIVNCFDKKEFLFPEKVNKKLETLDLTKPLKRNAKKKVGFNPLLLLVKINSFFPLLVWHKIEPKIKQKEFLSTFKFAVGITLFPLFYFFQKIIVAYFFGATIGSIYLICSFLSVFILSKTR